jgi:hypothetical protein
MLLGSLLFVAASVYTVRSGDGLRRTIWGFAGLTFSGLSASFSALMLLPGAGYLRLEPEGFTVCSLFRRRFFRWSSISEFGVMRIGARRPQFIVGMRYQPDTPIQARIGSFNARHWGFEGALPDTYGMTTDQLASLMNEALAQFRTQPVID